MTALTILQKLDDEALATIAEEAIRLLDARHGDAEAEPEEEGCCEAGDDIGSKNHRSLTFARCNHHGIGFPGDPEDAELDDEREDDDPAEAFITQGLGGGGCTWETGDDGVTRPGPGLLTPFSAMVRR